MRIFIAAEVPLAVRAALEQQINRLRRSRSHVSWVTPENLHITLAFLGDVGVESVAELARIMDAITAEAVPFDMECAGLGTFGSLRSPRIIWAGIEEGSVALRALQGRLAERIRAAGFHLEDRPFHAHITLGRVRSSRGARDLTSVLGSDKNARFGRFRVERLVLMRSHLGPNGAMYSVLHASPLKGAGK